MINLFLQNGLAKLNYGGEDQLIKLRQHGEQLTQQSRQLKERINSFVARRPHTTFTYTDPTPNFDRRQVYGAICRLINVKNPETAFALEIAAGGRVFFVVLKLIFYITKIIFSYMKLSWTMKM